jgi:hypothetical protein
MFIKCYLITSVMDFKELFLKATPLEDVLEKGHLVSEERAKNLRLEETRKKLHDAVGYSNLPFRKRLLMRSCEFFNIWEGFPKSLDKMAKVFYDVGMVSSVEEAEELIPRLEGSSVYIEYTNEDVTLNGATDEKGNKLYRLKFAHYHGGF